MQKIFFGAPGTGKSYHVMEMAKNNKVDDERVFRITFHPEFTYNDFVGQLKPQVKKSGAGKGDITYDFVKGIFTKALEKAYEDTSKDVYLIIEEMSRGNCSAIFGDIFQLLDREKGGVFDGYSRFAINNDLITNDIPDNQGVKGNQFKLPCNFHIFGTVNTTDQNVFVMDTAFKRRFEWEYIDTKPVGKPYYNNPQINLHLNGNSKKVNWTDLYGTLNIFISSNEYMNLGEDKQIGQFFIEFDNDAAVDKEKIKNKLLHYLWFDVQKTSYKKDISIFVDNIKNFADLYDRFENDKQVFSDKFFECLDLWLSNKL